MIAVTILVLCAVSALGHPTEHRAPISSHVEESLIELINSHRDAAVSITKELSKVSKDFSEAIKNILENLVLLELPELITVGGLELFIDGVCTFWSELPIIGAALEVGGKALETEGRMWGTIALNFLKIVKDITELNLDVWNSLAQTHLEALEEASKNSASIILQYLKDEAENLNEGYHKTYSIIEAVYEALKNHKDTHYHSHHHVQNENHYEHESHYQNENHNQHDNPNQNDNHKQNGGYNHNHHHSD